MAGQERKRGIPFPPGLKELPLPHDKSDVICQAVLDLEILWFLLRQELNLGRDLQEKVINGFFDNLSEETEEWLLADDPKLKKPRAVLIKERAIQLAQRKDGYLLEDPQNQEKIALLRTLITRAKTAV